MTESDTLGDSEKWPMLRGSDLRQPLPRKAAGSRQERPDSKQKQKEPNMGQSGMCFRSHSPELEPRFI